MLILDFVLVQTLLAIVEILALLEDVCLPMDKLLVNLPLLNVLEMYVTHLLAILRLDNVKLVLLLYVMIAMLVPVTHAVLPEDVFTNQFHVTM